MSLKSLKRSRSLIQKRPLIRKPNLGTQATDHFSLNKMFKEGLALQCLGNISGKNAKLTGSLRGLSFVLELRQSSSSSLQGMLIPKGPEVLAMLILPELIGMNHSELPPLESFT